MVNWTWRLSYSTYSLYKESPLRFYYYKIVNAKPSNDTIQAFGSAGNIFHSGAEHYTKYRDKKQSLNVVDSEWIQKNMISQLSFNNKPLDKTNYERFLKRAIEFIDNNFNKEGAKYTTELEMHLKKEDLANLPMIMFIDVVEELPNGDVNFYDWKSDSTATYEKHKLQRLFYSWFWWKKKGIIPKRCFWVYTHDKTQTTFEDSFTLEEIKAFDIEIKKWIASIILKKDKIENYEIGEINSPFNQFKILCLKEKFRRENKNIIQAERINNKLYFPNDIPSEFKKLVNNYFSFEIENKEWIPAYQDKRFDGYVRFLKKKTLPYPFINKFKELLEAYNKRTGNDYKLNIEDKRDQSVVNCKFNTKFKKSDIILRDYQEEAVEIAIKKEISILGLATSSGKTVIGAEIMKRLNNRSLFVVGRIELCRQSKKELEDFLGVEVGVIAEGKADTTKQITVSTIQTILSLLKKKNKDTKELKQYLYNVNNFIADECHSCNNSIMYGSLSKELVNVNHIVGLSATPMRLQNETMEMNSLVGFVEYKKNMKELQELGYLTPTKVYFINSKNPKNEIESGDYHIDYKNLIVNNQERNNKALEIVKKYRDTKKILIVCKSIEHGELISSQIENSYFLNGKSKRKERKDKFEEFKDTNNIILVSMNSIMKQGISIKSLEIIINMSGHNSPIDSIQLVGRSKRQHPGKKFGIFFDFLDTENFLPMAMNRIKTLEELGETVNIIDSVEEVKIE